MSHLHSTSTFVSVSARLDNACHWLENLGIEYSVTRVGKYKRIFTTLAQYQLEDKLDDLLQEYELGDVVNAAHEVSEILRIFEGLADVKDKALIDRLRDSIKGHELYVLDKSDRSGRDFSLELATAAKFARAGLRIDFGDAADLRTQYGPFRLYVECKRLKSQSKIKDRIKNGLNQLRSRYQKAESPLMCRGLLVLSVSKIINTNFGILDVESVESLAHTLSAYNERFIKDYSSYWRRHPEKRTLGVAVILDAPAIVKSSNQLTTCHDVALNNAIPVSSSDYPLLLAIAQEVFAGGSPLSFNRQK